MSVFDRDWQIHVSEDFMLGADMVIVYAKLPDGSVDFLQSCDIDGQTVMFHVNEGALDRQLKGLALPKGVLEAIAEHVKPGPSQGEIKRLEEALTIERARVDDLLRRQPLVVHAPSGSVHP